jgi:hypothetical protein
MTLTQIKEAIAAGKTVCWANDGYTVIKGKFDYLIGWNVGGRGANYIGLTHTDGITLNGREDQFYIKE